MNTRNRAPRERPRRMRLYFRSGEKLPESGETVLRGGSSAGMRYAVTISRVLGEPRQDDAGLVRLEVLATQRLIAGEALDVDEASGLPLWRAWPPWRSSARRAGLLSPRSLRR